MSHAQRNTSGHQNSAFERARFRSMRRMSQVTARHNVSFSTLTIMEFSIRPCDNPACTEGPPIAIDKVVNKKGPINIDLFEFAKTDKPRKKQDDLRLTRYDREDCLKEHGYSRSQIEEAAALIERKPAEKSPKTKISSFFKSKT